MRGWVRVAGWTWCGGVAALLALRFLDLTGPVPAVQSLLPLALGSLVLLLGLSLLRRCSSLALASGLLLTVGVVGSAPWFWPGHSSPPASSDTVVLAANLQYGQGEMTEIVELVRHHEADALVLLEATSGTADQIAAGPLGDLLPHVSGEVREDAGGTLVLTAAPHTALSDPPMGTFLQVAVQIEGVGPQGDWSLVAVHPAPPLLVTSERWRADLASLQAWVDGNDDDRLVLAGDFNASQAHPAFRAVAQDLVQAHREAGAGWVRTWPMGTALPAYIQLDHVLVRGFAVQDAGVADIAGSDHRLVWARLR